MKKRLLIAALLCCCLAALLTTPCFAQVTPTPTPPGSPGLGIGTTGTNWVFDPVITELGKNSERARELLYWAFAHSPIYTAPALGQMWGYSRNIVYLFFVLVLVVAGVGYIFFRSWRVPEIFSGISPPIVSSVVKFIVKLAGLILFATFSYVLVLGLVQFGEVLMRFFIEKIGGCNLFNIKFVSDAGTETCVWPGDPGFQDVIMEMEKNYTEFEGFRDTNVYNIEMVNTSIFMIRLTNLTYNVMAALLILRHIILWFLMILSPFLALLVPFIFIRNVGWIWIGVFFQWLFYGPLAALFVAGLTRIWQAGIPYQFDFSRVDKDIGQIYPTSINILYGGPAQTLTPTNSANYIDTYAEYVIALIMLWACMFLPWLLLRIFRDYCCIGGEGQATLRQILDRLRGAGPLAPPIPPSPPTTIAEAIRLPFRKKAEIPKKLALEQIASVAKAETQQLAQAMNLSVSSLQEVAQYEMSREMQRQAKVNLDKISRPERIFRSEERDRYTQVRSELFTRAARGDRTAQRLLSAVRREPKEVFKITPAVVPTRVPRVEPAVISRAAQKAQISEEKISKIVQAVPMAGTGPERTRIIARQTGVPEEKVSQVLKTIPTITPAVVAPLVKSPLVTVEDYEEVKKMWVKHYQESEVPTTEKIKTREDWVGTDIKKLTNALSLLTSIKEEDKQIGIEQVANILPFLLLGGFSDLETVTYIKAKLEAAKQILDVLEKEEKIKAKAREEEELVEVPAKEREEKLKEMELKAKREREMPEKEEEPRGEEEREGEKELPGS